jgi:dUTP pyrophosphatase
VEAKQPSDFAGIEAGVLSSEQLRAMCAGTEPLVYGWADLDAQIQPNGFDFRLESVAHHCGRGVIGISNADRVLPGLEPVEPDPGGWFDLAAGIYLITFAETVQLPGNLMALARPRSSLNRSGVTIHGAVWDAGYHGRSTGLLSVLNPAGFRVQRGARVMQMVFFSLSQSTANLYRGRYQGENLKPANGG